MDILSVPALVFFAPNSTNSEKGKRGENYLWDAKMTGMFTNQHDYVPGVTPKRIVIYEVKFTRIGSAADWEHRN